MTANELLLRLGTLEDMEAVLALDQATALLPHWTADEYAKGVTTDAELRAETGIQRVLLIAESGHALSGFIAAKITRIGGEVTAELESVAVDSSCQRRGIGKALCVAAIEWAREQGAGSMELEVRSRNEAAIALYAGLGFAGQGRRPRYYRDPADDALLMRLGLSGLD